MNDIPQYPWDEGDTVYASALNAAFANVANLGGPYPSNVNVRYFGAKGDVKNVVTNVTLTSGSPVLAVSTALFAPADVGKAIRVTNGNTATQDIDGTIVSITDPQHVILDINFGVTVTAQSQNVIWGTRDGDAIKDAVATVPASGGALYFPQGDYMLDQPITLPSQVTVFGHGATVTAAGWRSWTSTGHALQWAFTANGQSDITIRNMRFVWPLGHINFGTTGAAHILYFTGCTRLRVLDNKFVGGSDASAMVACSDTLVQGNSALNYSCVAWDHWDAMHDTRVIGNWSSILATETNPGLAGTAFTGSDGVVSTATSGFICVGNFFIANNSMTVVSINNLDTGANGSNRFVVADNSIVTTTGALCWGVLVNGTAKNGIIHNNYFEGSSGGYAAVTIESPTANVRVHHNIAVNWNAGATGIFRNLGTNGSLTENAAYGCSSPMLGPSDATTVIFGNSTGADSSITLNNVNINNGTAIFSGAVTAEAGITAGYSGAGGAYMIANSGVGIRGMFAETNGVNRWVWGADGTAEGGSNAGSNWQVYRYTDAGSPVGPALLISRASGALTISELPTSTTYANDAAAATGGVAVGQLYRNGSAVQVRVT